MITPSSLPFSSPCLLISHFPSPPFPPSTPPPTPLSAMSLWVIYQQQDTTWSSQSQTDGDVNARAHTRRHYLQNRQDVPGSARRNTRKFSTQTLWLLQPIGGQEGLPLVRRHTEFTLRKGLARACENQQTPTDTHRQAGRHGRFDSHACSQILIKC